jgi:hypothetical protein
MFKMAKLGIAIAAVLALIVPAAYAGVPDVSQSFYVPQIGLTTSPIEGTTAIVQFKACPNNDGGTSLTGSARIKVVVRDVNGSPIAGIAAGDICLLFNGGTTAQGFSGVGADSIIANSTYNPTCPDVRCMSADAPTDSMGTTYITFTGANESAPGVGVRNPNRKWGHYDSEIPVYVLGFKINGRLTTASANGSYVLRIKNFDMSPAEGFCTNPSDPGCTGTGERVNGLDFNLLVARLNKAFVPALDYWLDYNNTNSINGLDFNLFVPHLNHNCTAPNNP